MSTATGGLAAGFDTQVRPSAEVAHPAGAGHPQPPDRWRPALVYGAVALALFVVVGVSVAYLPMSQTPKNWRVLRHLPFLEGWARWDAGWYWEIVRHGYFLDETRQSPVAFFPGYPFAIGRLAPYVGGPLVAGVLVTLAAGAGAVVLFYRWCVDRLGVPAARTALLALVLYPFAYYLVGAVYADALYLLAALGAFTLLERGHPVLAGLVGAVASATRPIGYAVVIGLVLRSLELRDDWPLARKGRVSPARHREPVGLARAGVLLSVTGFVGYCGWLWYRFGDPLAFVAAQGEWNQAPSFATWSKQAALEALATPELDLFHGRIVLHAGLTLLFIGLLPVVVRRLGWAYGAYAAAAILVPTLTSADFVGLGRYMLAAFPCFAVLGQLLAERPRLRAPVLAMSALSLVVLTSLFSRWNYVS